MPPQDEDETDKRVSVPAEVFKFLLGTVYAVLLILLGPASLWLAITAQTLIGRGLAAMGLLTLAIAADLFLWFRRKAYPRLWGWSTVVLVMVWIGVGALILRAAPTGQVPAGSPVSHRFTSPAAFRRYALANVIPEVEQVNLGLWAAPLLDPILTYGQSRRVAKLTLGLYEEMERDANFHALGSAMCWAYADGLGVSADVGHYYLYVPRKPAAGPRAALLFLHGSVGNLKVYTWVWSQLAEQRGCVVIAPSCGMGNWRGPGPVPAVLKALEHASKITRIDPARVFLVGLSNGGRGVCRVARAEAGRFRGLVMISPVMVAGIVREKAFHDLWRARPVLILAGQADRRVPVDHVRKHAEAMKSGGINVRQIIYPGEDHFLLFSKRREVLKDIAAWMTESER